MLVVLGWQGGAPGPGPNPGGGFSQEAVTGEDEPSKALAVPLHRDVLQALVAPPHGGGWGWGSPRNAETGQVCSGRGPSSAAGLVDSQA